MGEAISLHTRQYSQSPKFPNTTGATFSYFHVFLDWFQEQSTRTFRTIPRVLPMLQYSAIHRRVIRQYPVGRSFVTIVVPTLFVETSYIEQGHHLPWRKKKGKEKKLKEVPSTGIELANFDWMVCWFHPSLQRH